MRVELPHFRRLSIRQKLLLLIGGISTATLGVAFGFDLFHAITTFRREMVANALVVARVTGEYTVADLTFEDQDAAAESLGKLAGVPAIRSACLFDTDDVLFSVYGEASACAAGLGENSLAATSAPLGNDASVSFLDDLLHVVQPVVYQGERYGTIYLRLSTEELDAKIVRHLGTLAVALVLLVGLALLATFRLERMISGPILDLATTTRRISLTGDYSVRFENDSEDEIGTLRDGFNDMLEVIHRREEERDEAEHRTREKSLFLANMSHELRTPLNSIIGFSEILLGRLSTDLDERSHRFLSHISHSGKHLLLIINDILDLSKVEAGRMEIEPEPLRLADVIESVARLMKPLADKKTITIDVDLPARLPIIELDPVRAKQIFYNLLSNAVKFSPEGSTVNVVVRQVDAGSSPIGERSLEVAVIDHGLGIAPEDHEKVFQSFRQVDGSVARRFGGTGLGLALVKTFVEMHDGAVVLESELGEGSTFRVVLPQREIESETVETRREANTVLVVEDDPETGDSLRRLLQNAGFEPVVAANGDAAIALARSTRPAAISLDLVLPGMTDGWEVLRTLKADPETCNIPIVVFSRLENRELGLSLGVDDYFLKPMDMQRMVTRLGELAESGQTEGLTDEEPRVLVIDDDRAVHDLLSARLASSGFRVEHAYSKAEGVAKAMARRPDLVVFDLMMDQMDGFGVAMELRLHPETATIPMIALTSHDLTEADRRQLHGRSLDFLGKGEASGDRLIGVLRQLVKRQPTEDQDQKEPSVESET